MSGPGPIIIERSSPNLSGPNPHLIKSDFDQLIWNKGYNVYHEKMIQCPCFVKTETPDGDKKSQKSMHSPDCKNCGGSGYVLIQRVKTKMLLQSMNLDTKFKEWSEERLGTVKITASDKDNLSHMDRIVVLDSETYSNELIYPINFKNVIFSSTIYDILEIEFIVMFLGDDELLKPLTEGEDYTIKDNKIIFDPKFKPLLNNKGLQKVSVKYKHRPQFHVIDLLRDIINQDTTELNDKAIIPAAKFPTHAIGRRSHFVLDAQNYTSDIILDNTTTTGKSCGDKLISSTEEKC